MEYSRKMKEEMLKCVFSTQSIQDAMGSCCFRIFGDNLPWKKNSDLSMIMLNTMCFFLGSTNYINFKFLLICYERINNHVDVFLENQAIFSRFIKKL